MVTFKDHKLNEFALLCAFCIVTLGLFATVISLWGVISFSESPFRTLSECLAKFPNEPIWICYLTFYVLYVLTSAFFLYVSYMEDSGPIRATGEEDKAEEEEGKGKKRNNCCVHTSGYKRRLGCYVFWSILYVFTTLYTVPNLLLLLLFDTSSSSYAHRLFASIAFVSLVLKGLALFLRRVYAHKEIRQAGLLFLNILLVLGSIIVLILFVSTGNPLLEFVLAIVLTPDALFQLSDYWLNYQMETKRREESTRRNKEKEAEEKMALLTIGKEQEEEGI